MAINGFAYKLIEAENQELHHMDLESAINEFLLFNYQLAPKTKQIYREHPTRLAAFLGNPPLKTITHRQIAIFFGSLKKLNGKPYAPGYLDQIWRTLHTFFQFWILEGEIETNPMRRVPRPPRDEGPKEHLSLSQVKQLLTAIKHTTLAERNKAMILLMVDSGLRVGEVVSLRTKDLHLDDRFCYVYDAKERKRRKVPLSRSMIKALRVYLGSRPLGQRKPVFSTRKGEPITYNAIRLLVDRLEEKLGFDLWPHLLRHTFASLYLKKGNMKNLQTILGHSTIDITARFYAHPEWSDVQNEHDQAAPTELL